MTRTFASLSSDLAETSEITISIESRRWRRRFSAADLPLSPVAPPKRMTLLVSTRVVVWPKRGNGI